MSSKVELLKRGELGVITIQNPPLNTLSFDVINELDSVLDSVDEDGEIKLVIITGRGLFSAGAEVKAIWDIVQKRDLGEAINLLRRVNSVINKVENLSKPTVAVVDGFCLGGGNELAMCCNFRIATDEAKFGQPEVNLNIMPGMGATQRLPRFIGLENSLRMLLSGEIISAKDALSYGLVDWVVSKKDILSEAKKFAQEVLSGSIVQNPIRATFSKADISSLLGQDNFRNLCNSKSADSVDAIIYAVEVGISLAMPEALKLEQRLFAELTMKDSAKRGLAKFLKIELAEVNIDQSKTQVRNEPVCAEIPPWEKDEYKMLRETVREFAERELSWDKVKLMEKNGEIPPGLIRQMGDIGFFGVSFPEKYGGSGMGKIGLCIIGDELTYAHPSAAVVMGAHSSLGCEAIYLFGTEDQKQRFLVPGIKGDKIGALVSTEPNVGSDVGAMRTLAKKVDGGWEVNGKKQFVTNGEIADFIVVFAQTDYLGGNKTLLALIVERGFLGLSVNKCEDKLGIHASKTNGLNLDKVFVPDRNVLGEAGQGFKMLMQIFNYSRITVASSSVGFIRRAIDEAIKFSKDRILFGEPMYMKQNTQLKLAKMEVLRFAVESAVFEAAWRADRGLDIRKEAAFVKYFGPEMAFKAVDMSLQLHGGYGFIDYPIAMFYRDVRIFRLFEGTSEIQLLTIAKEMIKSRIL